MKNVLQRVKYYAIYVTPQIIYVENAKILFVTFVANKIQVLIMKCTLCTKKNDTRCKVAESKIQRQRRLNKQKEYDHEKRSAESEIERQRRLTQDKDYQSRKRSAESERDKEMRLTQDKEYQSRKRSGESEIERKRRLNNKKNIYRQPTKDWEQPTETRSVT